MFSSVIASTLVVAIFASLTKALVLENPGILNDSSLVTLTWIPGADDPSSFSVDLSNPKLLPGGPIQIVDIIDSPQGSFTFNLPAVPVGDNYTIIAISNSNSSVLSTVGPISIVDTRIPNATSTAKTASSASATATSQSAVPGIPQAPTDSIVFPNSNPSGTSSGFSAAMPLMSSSSRAGIIISSIALVAGIALTIF